MVVHACSSVRRVSASCGMQDAVRANHGAKRAQRISHAQHTMRADAGEARRTTTATAAQTPLSTDTGANPPHLREAWLRHLRAQEGRRRLGLLLVVAVAQVRMGARRVGAWGLLLLLLLLLRGRQQERAAAATAAAAAHSER